MRALLIVVYYSLISQSDYILSRLVLKKNDYFIIHLEIKIFYVGFVILKRVIIQVFNKFPQIDWSRTVLDISELF